MGRGRLGLAVGGEVPLEGRAVYGVARAARSTRCPGHLLAVLSGLPLGRARFHYASALPRWPGAGTASGTGARSARIFLTVVVAGLHKTPLLLTATGPRHSESAVFSSSSGLKSPLLTSSQAPATTTASLPSPPLPSPPSSLSSPLPLFVLVRRCLRTPLITVRCDRHTKSIMATGKISNLMN